MAEDKDKGLTDAAAETAAKNPAPAKAEAKTETKAAAKNEDTPEETAARGDDQIAKFQREVNQLRAELDVAQAAPKPAQETATSGDDRAARYQREIEQLKAQLAEANAAPQAPRTAGAGTSLTAPADFQKAEHERELAELRAELNAAQGKQYADAFNNPVDASRARMLMVAQSEAAARASKPGEVPGGPVFEVPVLDPLTQEVKGYRTLNGRGEKVEK